MITGLKIFNFQSHKKSELDFHPGLNCIIGQSDSGKTAVLRALKWIINNRPSGDEFRSNWGGDTSVELKLNSDDIITRRKTNSKNEYWLNDEELKAFGQEVPEDVKKVLNMDSVNLQEQLDSPFLLSETSGNVAAHFNKVANLEIIDLANSNVQKEINRTTKTIGFTKEEIDEKKIQLDEFIDLEGLEKELNQWAKKQDLKLNMDLDIKNLQEAIKNLELVEENIAETAKLLNMSNRVDELLSKIEQRNKLVEDRKTLKALSIKLYNTNESIRQHEALIKAEPDFDRVLKIITECVIIDDDIDKLQLLHDKLERTNKKLEQKSVSIDSLEKDYKKALPDICPICNSKIR